MHEAVLSFYDAINSREYRDLLNLFEENGRAEMSNVEGEISPNSLGSFLENWWEAFPDLTRFPTAISIMGKYVFVAGRLLGTHTGEFQGIKATANEMSLDTIDIFKMHHDKISHLTMTYISGELAVQLNGKAPVAFPASLNGEW
jgi:hypothetical protein